MTTKTFGLTPDNWKRIIQLVVDPLKQIGAKIYVFGSRARGDHQEFSDLDLLVESESPLPIYLLSQIRSQLEESRLPIKVDVVDIHELADSFKGNVLRERVEIN